MLSRWKLSPLYGNVWVKALPRRELVRGEAFWNLYAATREASLWAPAGHLVYKLQVPAEGTGVYVSRPQLVSQEPLQVTRQDDALFVKGDRLDLSFDLTAGQLRSCSVAGRELLSQGKDRFYRALTGIDEGQGDNSYGQDWRAAGLHYLRPQVESVQLTQAPAAGAPSGPATCTVRRFVSP